MRETSLNRQFFRNVIPAVLSMALSGIYAIVDGYFVGNSVGDAGISAINMAYPVTGLIQGIGTGIGMGAAVTWSIWMAEGKNTKASETVASMVWMLLAASLVLSLAVGPFSWQLIGMLEASGNLQVIGSEYLRIIGLGASFQIIATGMVPLIRAAGSPVYSMASMIAGFFANVFLDYLFVWVFGMGTTGAAYATIAGQALTMVLAITFLIYKKILTLKMGRQPVRTEANLIISSGIAPFGLSMAPNICLTIVNWFSARYGGEPAIATYAVIQYMLCIMYLMLQGVGDGCQPLFSTFYGEKREEDLQKTRRMAFGFGLVLSAAGMIILFLLRYSLGGVFGASRAVSRSVGQAMVWWSTVGAVILASSLIVLLPKRKAASA